MVVKSDHKVFWITLIIILIFGLLGALYFFFGDEIKKLYTYEVDNSPKYSIIKKNSNLKVLSKISDEDAVKSDDYLEFSISLSSMMEQDIYYNIFLANKDIDESIKVFLTKVTNDNEEVVSNPLYVMFLDNYAELNNYKLLYRNSFHVSLDNMKMETTYRLRAWSNEEINDTTVTVDMNIKDLPLLAGCYVTNESAIVDYKCYKGNSYGMPELTDIVIPSYIGDQKITSIADEAFYNKEKNIGYGLTSVVIPAGITIGNDAFNSNNLKKIYLPIDLVSISDRAFANNSIEEVTIPISVTSIGSEAFANNVLTKLSVPSNVKKISYHAFYNNSLMSIVIYGKTNFESFEEIDYDAFGYMLGYGPKNIEFK